MSEEFAYVTHESFYDFNLINGSQNVSFINDTEQLNVWEYLLLFRGYRRSLSFEWAVWLTSVNVLIFVTGLLGNTAICLVIVKNSNMHTATNYYLFNLAVSDLTLLIFGLPHDVALYWNQYPWTLGEAFCKIRALISEMASYVSVLTIVAFSTERYFSICYPLYLYTMSGLQRAVRIISCLWIISLIAALPFAIFISVNYLDYPPNSGIILEESAFCAMFSQPENFPINEISTIVFFAIPMIIIAVQYTMMGLKILKRTKQSFGLSNNRKSQSHKAIIRMLAAVVVGFFVCWAPFHAQRLWYFYARNSDYFAVVNEWLFTITGVLYYFSSTLNPILYNIMSNRYRTAFKELLCGSKQRKNTLMRTSTVRETRMPSSHSTSEKTELKGGKYSCNISEDETTILMERRDILTVCSPKTKNTLIYQLDYNNLKPNSETCI